MIFVNDSVGVRGRCKVLVCVVFEFTKKVNHTVVLDQTSYVNSGINPISVDTHRDLDRPLTAGEITNLRGVCNAKSHRLDHSMQQRRARSTRRFHDQRSD